MRIVCFNIAFEDVFIQPLEAKHTTAVAEDKFSCPLHTRGSGIKAKGTMRVGVSDDEEHSASLRG